MSLDEKLATPRPADDAAALRAHIEHLDLHGYTIVENALDPEQLARLRAAAELLYQTDAGCLEKQKDLPDMLHLENLPNKGVAFERFFVNEHVLPLVRHFLGDDAIAGDICSFGIAPHGFTRASTAFGAFHSDDATQIPGYPLSMVNLYPLVDVTKENGATRVVPGSHRIGRRPEATSYEGEIVLEAPAGSCLVFFGSVWHASGPNWTDETRTTVVASFQRPWMKQYIDFTRSLRQEVIDRATPEALRIFGFPSRSPHTERWQWDEQAGRPLEAYRAELATDFGYGRCCL